MGLGEEYDHSNDQVLLMDRLPSVNKVYSMILKVGKKKANIVLNSDNTEIIALLAKSPIFRNKGGYVDIDTSQF